MASLRHLVTSVAVHPLHLVTSREAVSSLGLLIKSAALVTCLDRLVIPLTSHSSCSKSNRLLALLAKAVDANRKCEKKPNLQQAAVLIPGLSESTRLLSDPYTKLTCLFLQSSVPLFDDVNTILQKEETCIHIYTS